MKILGRNEKVHCLKCDEDQDEVADSYVYGGEKSRSQYAYERCVYCDAQMKFIRHESDFTKVMYSLTGSIR